MIKISPSVLAADFSRLGQEIEDMEKAEADMIHLDVMDGDFVPNISFGAPVIKSVRKNSKIFFDTHLMIKDPLKYAKDFIDAGSNRITFHLESSCDTRATIDFIKSHNVEVGISIKPRTKAEEVLPYLSSIDQILIMTVEPGFGGQSFMEDQCPKIKAIAEYKYKNSLNLDIQVDGGIDVTTAPKVTACGANVLVAGSALYSSKNYKLAVEKLRYAGEKAYNTGIALK